MKILENFKNIFFILFLITLVSCGGSTTVVEDDLFEETFDVFFDVVYLTKAIRPIGAEEAYQGISGERKVQFVVTTEFDEEAEEAPTEIDGTFRILYKDYINPLTGVGPCSGYYSGTFTYTKSTSTAEEEELDNSTYDVFEEYPMEGDNYSEEEVDEINQYNFNIKVKDNYLLSNCPVINEEFMLKALRFSSGELLLYEYFSGIEYFLVPEVKDPL